MRKTFFGATDKQKAEKKQIPSPNSTNTQNLNTKQRDKTRKKRKKKKLTVARRERKRERGRGKLISCNGSDRAERLEIKLLLFQTENSQSDGRRDRQAAVIWILGASAAAKNPPTKKKIEKGREKEVAEKLTREREKKRDKTFVNKAAAPAD